MRHNNSRFHLSLLRYGEHAQTVSTDVKMVLGCNDVSLLNTNLKKNFPWLYKMIILERTCVYVFMCVCKSEGETQTEGERNTSSFYSLLNFSVTIKVA